MGIQLSQNTLTNIKKTPIQWHKGEDEMHEISGHQVDVRLIRRWMPEQHRDFFCGIGANTVLFIGSLDKENRPWASTLIGKKGSVLSPSETELEINTPLIYGDPLRENLKNGGKVGMLGMEFDTRRRNRMNGTVQKLNQKNLQFSIIVDQSFGNCPKYIQTRQWAFNPTLLSTHGSIRQFSKTFTLSTYQKDLITHANNFWIASSYIFDEDDASSGVDVSHRGGNPGFVRVLNFEDEDENKNVNINEKKKVSLKFPDYIGNYLFQTLGNLLKNPKCGLLFFDYKNGTTLQMTGKAYVLKDEKSMTGAQRMVEFFPEEFIEIKEALPITFSDEVDYSPFNPSTSEKSGNQIGNSGLEQIKMFCTKISLESKNAKTYTFTCGLPLSFIAGQYANFDIKIENEIFKRTWTLSFPSQETNYNFSITVKRKVEGKVSNWIFENLQIGDSFIMTGLGGDFTLEKWIKKGILETKVLMIAAGVGITPIASMISDISLRAIEKADIKLIYGSKTKSEIIFEDRLNNDKHIFAHHNSSLQVFHFLSSEKIENQKDFYFGRISKISIESLVDNIKEREVFLCGPENFLQAMELILEELKVPSNQIHQERFNF